jgi:hypothetical protein
MTAKEGGLLPYLVQLLIFTCIIILIVYAVEPAIPSKFRSGWIFPLIYFFAVTTLLLHLFLRKASKGNPKRFITYFMGATGIKLFLYMAVLLIFILFKPDRAVGFVLEFFILYLFFTAYEVYFILKLKHTDQ